MSFGSQLKAYAKKQNIRAEKIAAAAIIETTTAVIKRTPVDSGRLRGNWQASANSPKGGEVEREDQSGGATLAEASNEVRKSIGGVYYLVNNLPYARAVEYGLFKGAGPKITAAGYSTQAPAGMVRVSVNEFRQALERALRSN